MACPAVFHGEELVGYDLIDLRRYTRRPLARILAPKDGTSSRGRLRFDAAAIHVGTRAILSAVQAELDMVVIDEVGPLEFRGEGWASALRVALRDCATRQKLLIVVRAGLADQLPIRFPSELWATADSVSPPWPAMTMA